MRPFCIDAMRRLALPALLGWIAAACGPALAATTPYTLTFTASKGDAPLSGSFLHDDVTGAVTGLTVKSKSGTLFDDFYVDPTPPPCTSMFSVLTKTCDSAVVIEYLWIEATGIDDGTGVPKVDFIFGVANRTGIWLWNQSLEVDPAANRGPVEWVGFGGWEIARVSEPLPLGLIGLGLAGLALTRKTRKTPKTRTAD